jgi:hypothetical protein
MESIKGIFAIGLVALIIAAIGGWIANIVKMVGLFSDPIGAWLIGRAIGIFVAPLGAILGYL